MQIMWELVLNIGMFLTLIYMSYEDIKNKSISIYSVIALLIQAMVYVLVKNQINIKEIAVIIIIQACALTFALITKQIGAGDIIVLGIIAIARGIYTSLIVFLFATVILAIINIILVILKKVTYKTKIPFIPYVTLSMAGVMLCV